MTLLLLAGTQEAVRIAGALADRGHDVLASLAGATRAPEPLPVPTRVGGFGGEAAFRAFLAEKDISAVLDATHPFATKITARTARVCQDLGLSHAAVVRPSWEAEADDDWTVVASPMDVALHVPNDATVFLATGRSTLTKYAALEGRRVLCRLIDPPTEPFPFEGGEFVIGRPPFVAAGEKALFEALGVTHLVVKNAGGDGGRAKLDAARALGLPVIMLRRPAMPNVLAFSSVRDALAWVEGL